MSASSSSSSPPSSSSSFTALQSSAMPPPPPPQSKPTHEIRDVSRDLFSASIGSVFCCYVGQPFDTVKVRMQTNPESYPSIPSTIANTFHEGPSAFWKGAVPTAFGMMAENCMAFGVNEALKRTFPDEGLASKDMTVKPDLTRPFFMGAITGCFSATVLLPSEVVKAKTQVTVGSGHSSGDIIREMIRKHGARSMFVGFDGQLCRDGSFYAFFFGGYELFKYGFRLYVPSMPDELNYFLSGGFAGMLGWVMAMPFDVPKTNVQSRWDTKIFGSYIPQMTTIAKERGLLGLYGGLGPTLLRAFPANAALFLGVEMGKRLFDDAVWKK